MSKHTGGPAFPSLRDERRNPDFAHEEGMSLRDYFAAKALPAILTAANRSILEAARWAYRVADAMLAAREEE